MGLQPCVYIAAVHRTAQEIDQEMRHQWQLSLLRCEFIAAHSSNVHVQEERHCTGEFRVYLDYCLDLEKEEC